MRPGTGNQGGKRGEIDPAPGNLRYTLPLIYHMAFSPVRIILVQP